MAPPPVPQLLSPRTPLPSRTLASSGVVRDYLLKVRQATSSTVTVVATDNSGNGGGNNLSGGAIAGIVIGSVVGFLLLLWILRSCFNLGAPPNDEREAWYRDVEPRSAHYRHRHRHSDGRRSRSRDDGRYYYSSDGRSHSRPPSYGMYTQSTPVSEPVPVVVRGSSRHRRSSVSKARSPRRSGTIVLEEQRGRY
ncbi:hypothetical protein Sste5346_008385 [Sporothrix stenoceras]|uniref:Uncharacterized protein n=1 Tax=Sporothrix stenoceras TaxID=5173 RepID=A0ABR3YQR5_9PEZI